MIAPDTTGTCPHCKIQVRFERVEIRPAGDDMRPNWVRFLTRNKYFDVIPAGCPGCGEITLIAEEKGELRNPHETAEKLGLLLWPDEGARLVPREVEDEAPELAADFREASTVFSKSKKASAALSRRCLQFVLREKGGAKSGNLSKQIEDILNDLPSELGSNVDAIRQVGNFAAHPIKETNSGEIVGVEEGEAEWLLDILEDLFEHYYVAPARASARRDALNKKLGDIGKPPLKKPDC